jgi:hypothetical protein
VKSFAIAIILLITAAILFSGCTGKAPEGNATPTATTKPEATAATVTPAQAQANGGSGQPINVSQWFNSNGLHSYAYRMNQTTYGLTEVYTYEINYSDETYNGVAARHTTTNSSIPALGGGSLGYEIMDIYTGKADNSPLGGHDKLVKNGKTLIDQDLPASQANVNMSHDMVKSGEATPDVVLINEGPDTVTIDGKTYACTKYQMAELNETIWYDPQAPMPIKDLFTTGNYTQVIELLSWS